MTYKKRKKTSIRYVLKHTPQMEGDEVSHIPKTILRSIKKIKPHSYKQSLYGRLLVARLASIPKEEVGEFLCESLTSFYSKKYHFYWSLSHKKDLVGAVIDRKPIGMDIEYTEKKDTHLFKIFTPEEWCILGRKTWGAFYTGWTAKEATLKLLSLPFECIKNISIRKKRGDVLMLSYNRCIILARIFTQKNVVIAIAQKNISDHDTYMRQEI